MKREKIEELLPEAPKETLDKIMAWNGEDIEKAKGKATELESELNKKKTAFDELTKEMETLKSQNASAEAYKTKFEELEGKVRKAEEERAEKERLSAIEKRFDAVIGEKKFAHEAIRSDYLNKFNAALADKANEGKSDNDIIHELTKDDKAAFTTASGVRLRGPDGFVNNEEDDRKDIPHFF